MSETEDYDKSAIPSVEYDPVFVASPAYGIIAGDITNWDTAFGWGDHAGLYSLLGHNHASLYEPIGAVAAHVALANPHTQYALIAGLTTTANLDLPATTSASIGNINFGNVLCIHPLGTNLFIGKGSGNYTLTGGTNVGLGENTLTRLTSASNNLAIGAGSLYFATSGQMNVGIGYASLFYINTGEYNIGIGGLCGQGSPGLTTGSRNVLIGYASGYKGNGSNNVFIGYESGFYETGSNKLLIDNQDRFTEADSRTKSLIYGVFAADPANQILTVNGKVGVLMAPTYTLDITGNFRCSTGFGCNGTTPQTAYSGGSALAAYTTGAFGLNSDVNMAALHAMVVSIRAALVTNGIMS